MNRHKSHAKMAISVLFALVLMVSANCINPGTALAKMNDPTSPQLPADTLVVTSTADSGPGSFRQAILDAVAGDMITFDPGVFPAGSPVTIQLESTLPGIDIDDLTIDGSDSWVILDGSLIGSTPVTLLLDDISLSLDAGANLLSNPDFSSGEAYWRPWDDNPGAARSLNTSDFNSAPQSYEWSTVAQAGESRLVYDANGSSEPFSEWPYFEGSSAWLAASAGSIAEVSYWHRYFRPNVELIGQYPDGRVETFVSGDSSWQADWTQETFTATVPADVSAIGIFITFNHPEVFNSGLHITGSNNVVRGLQIVNFPGNGISLDSGATNNVIGGERDIGAGPLGQGNLLSGNGYTRSDPHGNGIYIGDPDTGYNNVQGNYIGVDLSGAVAFGNGTNGITLWFATHDNIILNNVISANNFRGVFMLNDDLGNIIQGNLIGLDVSGSQALGNNWDGIELSDGGWDDRAPRQTLIFDNVISANGGSAISISHATAISNTVQGNIIGGDASGSYALPNANDGITVGRGANQNVVGGLGAGEGNRIIANRNSGIYVHGSGTISNTVAGNIIGLGVGGARQAFPQDAAISPGYPSDCTLYAATTSSGVHKSEDCGENWVEANNGFGEASILQIKIPPDAPDAAAAYALAENGYLYRTDDGAATWSLVSTTLEGIDRYNLALSANFGGDQTMYAASRYWSWEELGGGPGVFKSTDGGINWTRLENGMSDDHVWKVIASPDPAAAGTLFALTDSTVEKSTDGGASWTTLSLPTGAQVTDLAMSPGYATDQVLFLSANDRFVYRSDDGGTTWSGSETNRDDPRHLAVSPAFASDSTVCHGGGWNDWLICSSDGGSSWSSVFTGVSGWMDERGTGVLFSPFYASDQTIFVASVGGMARSTDGGENFDYLRGLRQPGNQWGIAVASGATHNTIGPDNVVSNNIQGIHIDDQDTSYNTITGNLVGTNSSGIYAQANVENGIALNAGHDNVIEYNLVSGNNGNGIGLWNNETYSNTIRGNTIGTDLSGSTALGNRYTGIHLNGAHHNLIQDNLASGNLGSGLDLCCNGTEYNTIQGNYVGTDASGMAAIPNRGTGIYLGWGPSLNLVGGSTPAEGNLVSGNNSRGIELDGYGTYTNTISGNTIGLAADGQSVLGNGNFGVGLFNGASHNLIGGANNTPETGCSGECNLISGNGADGVGLRNEDTNYNTISGNYIGTDASGSIAIGNGEWDDGVGLRYGPMYNLVGGDTPGERNVIAGHGDNGVKLDNAYYNTVSGNYIGTDASGTHALPNAEQGVALQGGAHHNQIGGAGAGEGNLISGNGSDGINLRDGSHANTVLGNLIGTDASQSGPLANGLSAVLATQSLENKKDCHPVELKDPLLELISGIQSPTESGWSCSPSEENDPQAAEEVTSNGGDGVLVNRGSSLNVIGAGNVIAYNASSGVRIEDSDSLSNTITQNSIYLNSKLGIALTWDGNRGLEAPRITSVNLGAGTASGTACPNCVVEVFSADDDEGRIYEGSTLANGSGDFSFGKGSPLSGPNVTATATDPGGNTSPFSQLFDILWVNLGQEHTRWALERLGLEYTQVDIGNFASANLGDYDVLFVGSTFEWAPDDLYQPLVERKADIDSFVQNGGALVALSNGGDWGLNSTSLDWAWVPVTVTEGAETRRTHIIAPTHPLVEGFSDADLFYWWGAHGEAFDEWDWPGGTSIVQASIPGRSALLAGSYGSGRMLLTGMFPDEGDWGDTFLAAALKWAGGYLPDQPPQVRDAYPHPDGVAATGTRLRLRFDQLIDPASISGSDLVVVSDSGLVAGTQTFLPDIAEIIFTPDAALTPGELVTATLTASLADYNGNLLDGNGDTTGGDDFVWHFTVRAGDLLVVDSTDNEGTGTLREALEIAQPGDTITFDPLVFPPGSPATIAPDWHLPWMGDGYVTIDASDAGVILDGSYTSSDLLGISSDGNVLHGLTLINGTWNNLYMGSGAAFNMIGGDRGTGTGPNGEGNTFGFSGEWSIFVQHGGTISNTFQGNHIGLDPSGTTAWPNGQNWGASALFIEQGTDYTRIIDNVISGNNRSGLDINESYYVTVMDNYFGTDASGTVAMGNNFRGVVLHGGSRHATFEGNLFSANGRWGAQVSDIGTGENTFRNNLFGLDASGSVAIPNEYAALIIIYEPDNNLVEDNVLAGGTGPTILINGTNNIVRYNHIGTDITQTANWGSGNAGIAIESRYDLGFACSGNLIEGNVIANNRTGVLIEPGGSTLANGNVLTQNSIYNHDGEGIALYEGANDNMLPPLVLASNPAAGTASGTTCPSCMVEVFSDDDDEGRWYEGSAAADGAGNWSFAKGSAFNGSNVQATATDASGNTSEFSGPPPAISSLSPNGATPGTSDLGVNIYGASFRDNPPIGVDFGADISINEVIFNNPGEILVYLDIDPSASLGVRDVTVTNYDGQSDTLVSGFEVVAVPPPPPVVDAIYPDEIGPGVSGWMAVAGSGFINRPQVNLSGDGISVDQVVFGDPNTLFIQVSTSPTATLGLHDIYVQNPDGQSDLLVGGLEVVAPYFSDVATSQGVGLSSGEFGASWGDLDGDDDLDLAIGDGTLFENQMGTFTDLTGAAGLDLLPYLAGFSWGDYDNDGDNDLLSSWAKVYRQDSLPFVKVFDGGGGNNTFAWVDYDLDGDLDAFASEHLYRNDGLDTFVDITNSAGLGMSGQRLSSIFADYDGDGDPDLYMTCNGCPNQLFRNNGNGTFTDVTSAAGVGDSGSGHGSAWGDYDNDGDFDLFVANNNNEFNVLYRNNGNGTFTDVSYAAGFGFVPNFATGVNWIDYNLDGRLDLFIANRDAPNGLFRNNGDGTFTDYALASGMFDDRDSDGSTVGDYDNDGDPDIYVVNGVSGYGTPNFLFRNNLDPDAGGPHWLKVKLVGVLSNQSAIGAEVRVYGAGPLQTRQFAGSSGYMSQDALEALFGFGGYLGTVTVEVQWPSGVVDTLPGVALDQSLTVVESSPYLHDMAMVSLLPEGETPAGIAIEPMATVRNLGQFPETGAGVRCRILQGGSTLYNVNLTTGTIEPAAWGVLTFPAYTPPSEGEYTLTCSVTVSGDERASNNSLSHTLVVTEQIADAWTKDNPNDDGTVPSGLDNWYGSPDIWVRHSNDGGLIHQDPIAGVTNTVYVRLRNRGNVPVSGTMDVYWIEPSLGVRCGDWAPIGMVSFFDLLPGERRIVSMAWVPSRTGHSCMQSLIDSPNDPYDRGLECSPQWVPWDNNLSWRNINVFSNPLLQNRPSDIKEAQVQLVNIYSSPQDVDILIDRMSFPLSGEIVVILPRDLFDRWAAYQGAWGEDVQVDYANGEITITGAGVSTIGALPMAADEEVQLTLRFDGPAGLEFQMGIEEQIDGITTGGVVYQWTIPDTTPPQVLSVSPADLSSDVPVTEPLVIEFNEPVGPLSLDLQAAPDPGDWTFYWSEDSTVVTATHAAFTSLSEISLSVSASDGSTNAMDEPFTWSFNTADADPPEVTGVTPSDGAQQVALDQPVVIEFNEPIDPGSLDLTLLPNPGGWSFSWNSTNTIVTAAHNPFAGQTTYSASVSARDASGVEMLEAYGWSFTTTQAGGEIFLPVLNAEAP